MTQVRILIPLSLILLICFNANSQQLISLQEYDSLKINGYYDQLNNVQVIDNAIMANDYYMPETSSRSARAGGGCGCYIEPDATYIQAIPPSDDTPSLTLAIPFSFCFYGTQYDTVYINNNGNVSFGGSYPTFSGVAFPSDQYVMIAPFWGDVDTRSNGGEVVYKLTNSSLIVNWKDVGYYNQQSDKRNSFQLIITDGNDPILPSGNNVAFCYKDMEWTTGGASGGSNGFGGTPATVGANKGDNVQFVQFGRFDAPGTNYDGPFNNPDQVSWLDNQSFYFNACNSSNIPPVMTGLSQCDTVGLCVGDTFSFDISVLSPEQGQTTASQVVSAPTSFVITSNTTGVSSDVSGYMVGTNANAGYNTIELMSFDDGTPADTIYTNIVVFVDTTNFEPEIMGDTIICDGDTTTLMLDEPYDAYQWSGGSTNPELKTTGGTYVVTVTKGFCSKKDTHTVDIQILPQPTITGDTEFCEGGSTTLSIADTFDVFTWSTGDLTEDIVVDDSITVKVVVEKWNCENVDSVSLIINPLPEATIVGDTFYCLGSNTVLSVQNFAAYEWNNGNNTRSISATEGDYYCLVTDAKGCQAYSDTVQVTEIDPNEQIFGDTTICIRTGNLNTLNGADGNAVYAWSTGDSTQEITVGVGEYQLVVVDSMGCFDSSSVEVIYITTPVTDFSIDPDSFTVRKLDVQFTDLTMLDSGFIETYYWTFDELGNEGTSDRQNPVYAYQNEGLVEVTLTTTADNGCKASQSKPYLILREIPTSNVITPNGDGVNDVLYFKRLEYFPNSELTIYNRWGSVVYSTSDYRNDWDGDNLNEGVYYYVLKVSKIDQVHKGSVTILK